MKKIKIWFAVILTCSLFANCFSGIYAEDTLQELVAKLIYYGERDATTDEQRMLSSIKAISQSEYEKWNAMTDTWHWIEDDMMENIGVAPDGLPTDNTHAFVVLGFALKSDGTMEDELVGRLQVALASAQKYPNAYVLVTGGVQKNGWTEGDRMYEWLVANGMNPSRIIVENASSDTVENATFSFAKLYNDYNVQSISLITSQYHLKRASILYYTQSLLSAETYGKTPIRVLLSGNAGWYRADKTSEAKALKARSLSMIARVASEYTALNVNNPPLSILQGIEVKGKATYQKGESLAVVTTATYDQDGFQRDVSSLASISGYDANTLGKQTLHIEYMENGVTATTTFAIEVKTATAEATQQVPTNAGVATFDHHDATSYLELLGFALTICGMLWFHKKRVSLHNDQI